MYHTHIEFSDLFTLCEMNYKHFNHPQQEKFAQNTHKVHFLFNLSRNEKLFNPNMEHSLRWPFKNLTQSLKIVRLRTPQMTQPFFDPDGVS